MNEMLLGALSVVPALLRHCIDMSHFLSILGRINVKYCLVMLVMEYVVKIKLIALFVFLIGSNSKTNAYTREDLETYRTISAIASIGSITSAMDMHEHGRRFNIILAGASMVPMVADGILSAALEKNRHILTQIIDQINGIIMSEGPEFPTAKVVTEIIRIILTYWLFDVIKEKYPLKEQESTRRKWRVFVQASLTTIFYPLNERECRDFISLFCLRMSAFAGSFLGAALIEYLGSVVASNVEEKGAA